LEKDYSKRLNIMTMAVFIAVMIVVFRLGYVQIVHGADYRRDSDNNRYRQVLQLAPRGELFDSNGISLASNKPGFFVSMYHTNDPQSDEVLAIVSRIIDPSGTIEEATPEALKKRLRANRYRRWQPVRLTDTALEFGDPRLLEIEERRIELPGVFIDVQPVRSYPLGNVASHLIGAVGRYTGDRAAIADLGARGLEGYRVDSMVGRLGLEWAYEFVPSDISLKGVDGWQWVEVDNLSRPVQELERVDPMPGNDIYLTIDAELQAEIEEWLASDYVPNSLSKYAENAKEIGAVAIDPKTGKILTWISYPTFSPTELFTVRNLYSDLLTDVENNPLINKVITAYPPGSVFKPVTMITGLGAEVVGLNHAVTCTGRLFNDLLLGPRGKPCWFTAGHGSGIEIASALKNSCNIYFYEVGLQLRTAKGAGQVLNEISKVAAFLGLGVPTGIPNLPGFRQEAGTLPTNERFAQFAQTEVAAGNPRTLTPYPGEILDITIGQGIQSYTPLQIANYMAMLATGNRYQPYIVDRIVSSDAEVVMQTEPDLLAQLVRTVANPDGLIDQAAHDKILQGLREVVQPAKPGQPGLSLNGTAYGAFGNASYYASGKTGTAEVYRGNDALDPHGWFAGWGADPVTKDPEIVVAVFVKHGTGGSRAAAPIARRIMDTYFRLKAERIVAIP